MAPIKIKINKKQTQQKNTAKHPMFVKSVAVEATPQMTVRTIYVWGISYRIELPEGFDIYEGLRLKYPRLYMEVMNEEEAMRLAYQYGGKEETEEPEETYWTTIV